MIDETLDFIEVDRVRFEAFLAAHPGLLTHLITFSDPEHLVWYEDGMKFPEFVAQARMARDRESISPPPGDWLGHFDQFQVRQDYLEGATDE